MTNRRAECACGQLHLEAEGDPAVSVCHCLACQRRSGSAFAIQARYPRERVTEIYGKRKQFVRIGDEGTAATFHFCIECGSTLFYEQSARPDEVFIPVGAFADQRFPAPSTAVYCERRYPWLPSIPNTAEIE